MLGELEPIPFNVPFLSGKEQAAISEVFLKVCFMVVEDLVIFVNHGFAIC